jgi:tripartite-type tricarboxylate transporter receptor subunit TctC
MYDAHRSRKDEGGRHGHGPNHVMALLLLFTLGATLPFHAAHAQSYPTRPIHFVVSTSAGGSMDHVARSISPRLSQALGQPVIVENRAGANGVVGTEYVARAAPDGYTVVLTQPGAMVAGAAGQLPYDPLTDLAPITMAVEPVSCLAVNPSVPVHTVKELIDYVRQNSGKTSFGSTGVASPFHLMGEALQRLANARILHVPYKGGGPAMADLVAGQITMAFVSVSTAIPQARAGKIRVLAVTASRRYPKLPDVPSITESYRDFQKPPTWFGVFGPAGLSQAIVSRLSTEMTRALNTGEVKTRLEDIGLLVIAGTPAEFATALKADIPAYERAVKAAGLARK